MRPYLLFKKCRISYYFFSFKLMNFTVFASDKSICQKYWLWPYDLTIYLNFTELKRFKAKFDIDNYCLHILSQYFGGALIQSVKSLRSATLLHWSVSCFDEEAFIGFVTAFSLVKLVFRPCFVPGSQPRPTRASCEICLDGESTQIRIYFAWLKRQDNHWRYQGEVSESNYLELNGEEAILLWDETSISE